MEDVPELNVLFSSLLDVRCCSTFILVSAHLAHASLKPFHCGLVNEKEANDM